MWKDSEFQEAVIRELKWDTRVDETDVGVEVDEGIVTLTGTVDTYQKRLVAQEAAHRVFGVLDVANDIQVHMPGAGARTATEIAHAVRGALEWHTELPHENIRSTVVDGTVTIEGHVAHGSEREDAEEAVQHLVGVKDVVNRIVVVPPAVAPTTVQSEIDDCPIRDRRRARAAS